ncbi:MAG: isoamylase early set domain-containing protein [Anaerolineales bacterium]|nr:isoamylase early set domain-containing protein [Anaerolineales bacterium]
MIRKAYSKDGKTCRITFEIPAGSNAENAYLCGDFTEWEKTCITMKRQKDGSFKSSVTLKAGQEYYFRYLLDDDRWMNDETADKYVPNPFGSDDSVVIA